MPRVPAHSVESGPEQSRDEPKALEAEFGTVLNIHGETAHAPVVLQGCVALHQVLGDYGTFDAATREAIALVVGDVGRCGYCQSPHILSVEQAALSEEQAVAIREGRVDFDPKLAAAQPRPGVSGRPGHVDDAAWQPALDAGWSDEQLTEASVYIALNLLTTTSTTSSRDRARRPRRAGPRTDPAAPLCSVITAERPGRPARAGRARRSAG